MTIDRITRMIEVMDKTNGSLLVFFLCWYFVPFDYSSYIIKNDLILLLELIWLYFVLQLLLLAHPK